jgi:hypothetical protein
MPRVNLSRTEIDFLLRCMKKAERSDVSRCCSRDFYAEEQYEKITEKLEKANGRKKREE